MKQNSIFSYVKRNNNNSEGVDSNEQCSSNVKEAPSPKRTKFNSTAKLENGTAHIWDTGSFCEVVNVGGHIPATQEQLSH